MAEPSMTLTMAAVRLSRRIRETAVDAIVGRRSPFAIDAHCDLACACGIDHERLTPEDCVEPCLHRPSGFGDQGGCRAHSDGPAFGRVLG